MNAVSIENVSFAYGRQAVLRDITLKARPGDFLCLLGPSGCGKSTLLRLLAGLERPSQGRIIVGGKQVTGPGLTAGSSSGLFSFSLDDGGREHRFCP